MVARDAARAKKLAQRLVKRLAALPEAAMRRAVIGENLRAQPPEDLVWILAELYRGARRQRGLYAAVVADLAGVLGDESMLPYEKRAEMYQAARAGELTIVANLLFDAPPEESEEPPDPEQEILPASPDRAQSGARSKELSPQALRGKPLTLGERKALARLGRADLLQRLARDPDAAVIRIVLESPMLTERDVVGIAARRPVRRDVLRAVFSSRWLTGYPIKSALVKNPYTPSDIAVRLVATLESPDLRAVASDGKLSTIVRTQARLLLAE